MSDEQPLRVEITGEMLANLNKSAAMLDMTHEEALRTALNFLNVFARDTRKGRMMVTMEPDGSKMMRFHLK